MRMRPVMKCIGISFAVALLSMVYFLWRDEGAYVIGGDIMQQSVPFSAAMNTAIKQGAIPGWGWNIGLGTQTIGGYSVYNLGSPFFWITLPFSKLAYPFLTGWLYILKYVVAAVGAYWYMTLFIEDEHLSIAGALLYAFSSAQNQHLIYQFNDSIALFPFVMVGLEYILRGRKPWLFAFTVFLACATNYYLFVGEVVFCVVYFLCRMRDAECRGRFLQALGRSLLGGVLGVGMAAAIFLPSILFIMGNSRTGTGLAPLYYIGIDWLKMMRSILLPAEHMGSQSVIVIDGYGGYACYLPMVGVAYVIPYLLKRRDWLFVAIIVFSVFAASPLLESSFSMFTVVYKRWLYMFILLLSLASMRVASEREQYPLRAGTWAVMSMLLYLCLRLSYSRLIFSDKIFTMHVVTAYAGVLALVILQYVRNHYPALLLIGIAGFSFLTSLEIEWMIHGKGGPSTGYAQNFKAASNVPAVEDDYRYDFRDVYNLEISLSEGIGIGTFNSTISPSIADFQNLFDHTNTVVTINYDAVPGLAALVGARYHVAEYDAAGKPVVETQPACPIGYAYETCITEEELTALPLEQRGIASLTHLVVRSEDLPHVQDVLAHATTEGMEATEETIAALTERNTRSRVQEFQRDAQGFRCNTAYDEERVVFFSVPWDSGWRARIDGAEAEILKVLGGMMAIRVPEGAHALTFSYVTPGYRAGVLLAAIAWIVFCVLACRSYRKRDPRQGVL